MEFKELFPIWENLTPEQQNKLNAVIVQKTIKKGQRIHNDSSDCQGLLLLESGQLRAYILSDEGREVTVYRLIDMDLCLFTATCLVSGIQFDITIEAEKDTTMWIIPSNVYKDMMETSVVVSNFTNHILASRFNDVMWLVEQVLWKSFDKRLAAFLLEESRLEESMILSITHEKIANHMGTAREVVSRMMKYFQSEGLVKLSRGTVEILNAEGLRRAAE